MQTTTPSERSVYEIAREELRRFGSDEGFQKEVDREFHEARGREGARLHVTLRAVSETDARAARHKQETIDAIGRLTAELKERATALTHLVESFEATADKRFGGVHEDLQARAEALERQVHAFAAAESERFQSLRGQVTSFQQAISLQVQETRSAIAQQADQHVHGAQQLARENHERLSMQLREARDDLSSLIDSRMNQADASFAALRGDVEVVKFLVMDLIKDRIGRSDPKPKTY